jgi:hypothetical protein
MMSADWIQILPGMTCEDCAFHPVLCTHVHDDDSVSATSLVDGTAPHNCSLLRCGIELLSTADVIEIRRDLAGQVARRTSEMPGVALL